MTRLQEELRTATLRLVVVLGIITLISCCFDFGRYGKEFQENGLLGFLSLPSVLVFQIGYLIAAILLILMAQPIVESSVFRFFRILVVVAVLAYGSSLFLIFEASRAGMFGFAPATIVALLGIVPSVPFLLLGLPLLIVYAIRKSIAEPGPGAPVGDSEATEGPSSVS
jgi:hypothetical protein